MKKIVIYILIVISIYLVYDMASSQKINYVSIGDSLVKGINGYNIESYGYNNYVKNYLERNNYLRSYNTYFYNYSIVGLKNDLLNNKTYYIYDKEYYFKKILRESSILVISVGMDEIASILKNSDIDKLNSYQEELCENISNLVIEIRKYAVNEIIFLGYYNPYSNYTSDIDESFCYLNTILADIMKKNNIVFIDIYELVKAGHYLDNPQNYHLNTRGYLKIANKIIEQIEKS